MPRQQALGREGFLEKVLSKLKSNGQVEASQQGCTLVGPDNEKACWVPRAEKTLVNLAMEIKVFHS